MLAGPLVKRLAGKFRPLVGSNSLGVAPEASCLVEDARHVKSRNSEVDREINGLLTEVIDDGHLTMPKVGVRKHTLFATDWSLSFC